MYAITVAEPGGIEQIEWAPVPTPEPGPGEVLVRTQAVGVNRGDVLQRQGHYPPPKGVTDVMGLEGLGVIAELGEQVTGHEVGEQVLALLTGGAYAEYFVVAAEHLLSVPDGIDPIEAAGLVEVSATVVSNFDRVGLKAGETVLIHGGAGGVGSFAIQYAKAIGARVITTASKKKADYCIELGADKVIDYASDWEPAVMVATADRGVDVILDIIGAKYLEANVRCLATEGRMVTIGMQKGVKGTLNLGVLLNKRGTITATSLRGRPSDQRAAICRRVEEVVWPMLANGTIKPGNQTRVPLEEAARAHELLESGENTGKIILVAKYN
ncbi:MAG: NAD(P)H-quinone oxidoreductase [Propionibacteriaceae bacterium]|uniref:Alcohol dehydrogenase GroES-like domain n=1 Tax=Propionibacterium ruminifibrarum TaxID=1962131 RepID=A0A375I3N9_9ACTN|nr:NAD(P)H-quinone oxidoreductase [Propionibacterium ruminifibrarum]MBE6476619.1 NAD(P)H-quinone oxidoreductase [Propionibacteriaceae bacterium]SPF67823.1 Alcohol dehydrogenase GroES-like domain [Propionibacterium ruminifibrarum]